MHPIMSTTPAVSILVAFIYTCQHNTWLILMGEMAVIVDEGEATVLIPTR